jgi:hypothetical protein
MTPQQQHSADQLRDLAARLESGDLHTLNARESEWARLLRDLAHLVERAPDQAALDMLANRVTRIALGAMMRTFPDIFGPPHCLDAVMADPIRVASMARQICQMREGDSSGAHLAALLEWSNWRVLQ